MKIIVIPSTKQSKRQPKMKLNAYNLNYIGK